MNAEAYSGEWVKCPNCGVAFNLSERHSWTGYIHKTCGQKIKITNVEIQVKPIWCVVGNISEKPVLSEQIQLNKGMKHFYAGTKVYCYPRLWDVYKSTKVIGLHRGSRRYVSMVIDLKWLVNYKVKLVSTLR